MTIQVLYNLLTSTEDGKNESDYFDTYFVSIANNIKQCYITKQQRKFFQNRMYFIFIVTELIRQYQKVLFAFWEETSFYARQFFDSFSDKGMY